MSEKKVIISPKGPLLIVPKEWRRHFLIKSAEKALAEGRYTEIMQDITGVTIELLIQQDSMEPPLQQKKPAPTTQMVQPPVTLVRSIEPRANSPQEFFENEDVILRGIESIVKHDF